MNIRGITASNDGLKLSDTAHNAHKYSFVKEKDAKIQVR